MDNDRIKEFRGGPHEQMTSGGTREQPMAIERPLVVMFRSGDGDIICHIFPGQTDGYKAYGLLICDLVRHVANAFNVDEDDVWERIDKERRNPTSEITQVS
jgi:hypothetical protein